MGLKQSQTVISAYMTCVVLHACVPWLIVIIAALDEEGFQQTSSHLESSQAHKRLQNHASPCEGVPETLLWVHCTSKVPTAPLQYHQTAKPLQKDHCQEKGECDENRASEEAGG